MSQIPTYWNLTDIFCACLEEECERLEQENERELIVEYFKRFYSEGGLMEANILDWIDEMLEMAGITTDCRWYTAVKNSVDLSHIMNKIDELKIEYLGQME